MTAPHLSQSPDLWDDTGLPLPTIWQPLFEIFLKHFVEFFPSISQQRMHDRLDSGTMSRFLANTICALAAKHYTTSSFAPGTLSAAFVAKAQELAAPLIHLPATETVTGLVLLSWACYAQGSDSGLWQYSGMAIRMAVDIGINEVIEIYESPAHLIRCRHLWWSLFVVDRLVAFATGRLTAIPEEIVEIALPDDMDFYPDPSDDMKESTLQVEPVPFAFLVRLMVICGRLANTLNGRRGRPTTLLNQSEMPLAAQLKQLQGELSIFLLELPANLGWSIENLRTHHTRNHGVSSGEDVAHDRALFSVYTYGFTLSLYCSIDRNC